MPDNDVKINGQSLLELFDCPTDVTESALDNAIKAKAR